MKPLHLPEQPRGKPPHWHGTRILAFIIMAPFVFFGALYRLRQWFGIEFDLPDLTFGASPLILVVGFLGILAIYAGMARGTHLAPPGRREATRLLSFRWERWHVTMAVSVFVGGSIILSTVLLLLAFEWLWIGVGVLLMFGISALLFLGAYGIHILPQLVYYRYRGRQPPLPADLLRDDKPEIVVSEERIRGSGVE